MKRASTTPSEFSARALRAEEPQGRAGLIRSSAIRFPGRPALTVHARLLVLLFVLTLPLVNPWVRGDGVGYYAYIRALLIEHSLRFENDWKSANPSFALERVNAYGNIRPDQYTQTGYLVNNFAVGPSMLWAPFLVAAHAGVLTLDKLGAHIPADGFSRPYRVTLALATAAYGFAGLCLAFALARKYVEEKWAFLATVGIWFASSLPVYMYFNPSWSHAHSVFGVALFLWYWDRTRGERTPRQWVVLGVLAGLMIDIYYVNGIVLLVPALEARAGYAQVLRLPMRRAATLGRLFAAHVLFVAATLIALLPTFVTRKIIYGSPWKTGYPDVSTWAWTSPALGGVLFSPFHGLLSWTPIVIPAVLGLFLWRRHDKRMGTYLALTFLAYYYVIASRPGWHGLSSFGNRFFVSLTPLFILGLGVLLERAGERFARPSRAFLLAALATGLLIVWNLGFIFQWGMHMIPARGPISWRQMAYNQVAIVPARFADALNNYMFRRKDMMEHIEREDVKQLESAKKKTE